MKILAVQFKNPPILLLLIYNRIFLQSITILILLSTSSCFEIQNGVVGKPEVFCGIDTIRVKVNTEHPFNGEYAHKFEFHGVTPNEVHHWKCCV